MNQFAGLRVAVAAVVRDLIDQTIIVTVGNQPPPALFLFLLHHLGVVGVKIDEEIAGGGGQKRIGLEYK